MVTVSSMSRLRHLRATQMTQIYQACVAPALGYASTVWHDPLKDKTLLRVLSSVQRVALIRILSAFKTVATQKLEVEAYLPSTRLQLKRRGQDAVIRLFTLPKDHPIHSTLERARRRAIAKGNTPRLPLKQVMKTMDIEQLQTLEIIDPRPRAPWELNPLQVEFAPNLDRVKQMI